MTNWLSTILSNIASLFTANGTNAITGNLAGAQLTDDFNKIYSDLLSIPGVKGKATAGGNPGTPAEVQVWFVPALPANTTYTHFSGITVTALHYGYFLWDNVGLAWSFVDLGLIHVQNTDVGTNGTQFNIGIGYAGSGDIILYMKSRKVFRLFHTGGVPQFSPDNGVNWYTFSPGGGGGGDMFGPASSVAQNLLLFADTTGKLAGDSGIAASDLIPEKVHIAGSGSDTRSFGADTMFTLISVIAESTPCEFQLGITPGGQELFPDQVVAAGDCPITQNYYAAAGTTLYFNVLVGDATLRIDYKNNFKA